MNTKKRKIKLKFMVPIISTLVLISSFTVGFSMWIVTGGYDTTSTGFFSADTTTYVDNPVTLFTIPTDGKPSFTSLAGYGFLSGNEYVNTVTLNWSFIFKASTSTSVIESMSSNNVWFSISLSISNTPSQISNFSTTGMTLSGTNAGTPVIWQQTSNNNPVNFINDGSVINEQWNITGVDRTKANIIYNLSIPLTYTGTISDFPNLNTNKFTLSLTAGEYKNA